MQISLTYQEKLALGSRHKKCSDKRECDRIKAILLSDEGWSSAMISQALRKHPTQASKVSCGWIRTGVDKPVAELG